MAAQTKNHQTDGGSHHPLLYPHERCRPGGVLTQITRVLGDNQISISACIQKETDLTTQSAEIVIMTHPSNEAAMQKALKEMSTLSVVKEISNFIRVEDL